MFKKKARITTLILVLMFVTIVGVAYAATSGTLVFNGTASLGADVVLEIDPIIHAPGNANGSTGIMTVSPDGQTATISVEIKVPGDELEFTFQVQNTGDTDAEVTAVNTVIDSANSDAALTLGGNYVDFLDVDDIILAGQVSGVYSIIVGWDDDPEFDDSAGEYEFTISLPYVLYP
jgi:uncharacterized repeat protein (TIGR01451 family)